MKSAAIGQDEFVPFVTANAAAGSKGDSQVPLKIIPAADQKPAFSPLQFAGNDQSHRTGATNHKPVIHLQKEGDRITGIRLECGCGEIVEMSCQY